jgi:predicted glycoside hydrolase/deacetylase ChbG (UPF0249 family)
MDASRCLVVVADDYGIGPETSRAILELAGRGAVTAAVLLANSPHAADGVRKWRQSGVTLELGWHPSLTLDPPVAPVSRVPSLVGPDGCLWPLGKFLPRLLTGYIRASEVLTELRAQYDRFVELVGHPPTLVNSHQHTAVFPPVGDILLDVLAQARARPYMRRVREPWAMLRHVPGARVKRGVLSLLGRHYAQAQDRLGFPGHDWLAGITDPRWVKDPAFFPRWLGRVPGRVVELACHPGHYDATLIGRDCGADDGLLQRRVDELARLNEPSFFAAVQAAGFRLAAPAELTGRAGRGTSHAA